MNKNFSGIVYNKKITLSSIALILIKSKLNENYYLNFNLSWDLYWYKGLGNSLLVYNDMIEIITRFNEKRISRWHIGESVW